MLLEGVSLGVLGDEVFDSDGGQFCNIGTEFDSPYVKLPSMWYIFGSCGAECV